MSLACSSRFGSSKQKADTKWRKGAVGPPCLQTVWKPLLPDTVSSFEQVLRWRPSLKPSFAQFPTLKTEAVKNKGSKRIAKPVKNRQASISLPSSFSQENSNHSGIVNVNLNFKKKYIFFYINNYNNNLYF